MDKDQVVEFLEERLAKIKQESPGAFNTIAAYDQVINDVMSED